MMMTPDTLELDPRFAAAVEGLAGEETPVSEVVDLARHPDGWTASIALAALARRDDVPARMGRRGLPQPSARLQLRGRLPAAGSRPARSATGDRPDPGAHRRDQARVRRRVRPPPDRDGRDRGCGHVPRASDDRAGRRRRGVPRPDGDPTWATRCGKRSRSGGHSSCSVASDVSGSAPMTCLRRSWSAAGARSSSTRWPRSTPTPRRSVLLVGEHGAGKTAVLRAALDRLDGAVVFEATAAQVLAGAVFIGELETRVKELADGDERTRHDLGSARAPGGAVRRAAQPQPARAARRAAAQHRVRRDHGRRRGHADRTRAARGHPGRG